jgi:hypothetical protein
MEYIILITFQIGEKNAMPIQYLKKLIYNSKLSILKSEIKDLKKLAKYIPESILQSFWNNIYLLRTENFLK